MPRVVYFCSSPAKPSGGVKVIYRHARVINHLGAEHVSACVYHFENPSSSCSWYEGEVPLEKGGVFVAERDYIVLPECHLYDYWSRLKFQKIRYAIFVQNAYLLGGGLPREQIEAALRHADRVLSISDDSTRYLHRLFPDVVHKLMPLRWSVPLDSFRPSFQRSRLITFMPRRMADHAIRVIELLMASLPANWQIQAIDGMTETQVADVLSHSQIFLAFSGLEGLPLPPVEAALSGNRVVGYHGQGGREYWDPALFREVEPGNLIGFAQAVLEEVESIERGWATGVLPEEESRRVARQLLAHRFSAERENFLLRAFVQRVATSMTEGGTGLS